MLARILVLLAQVTILLSAELAEAQLVLCPGLDGFGGAYYHSQVPFVTVVTVSVGVGYRHTVYPETLQSLNFTSFGQPTRLITCANHGNSVICS